MTVENPNFVMLSPDVELEAKVNTRSGMISVLESTAHTLRVKQEKENIEENHLEATVKAKVLAEIVNTKVHFCECGKVFGKQQSYAGHKNTCGADE